MMDIELARRLSELYRCLRESIPEPLCPVIHVMGVVLPDQYALMYRVASIHHQGEWHSYCEPK